VRQGRKANPRTAHMTENDLRFPAAIRDIWSGLRSEIMWLHGRWIIYRQLYGTSPSRLEILNTSASTFFNILQFALLHDVQLSLSKIGDRAGSGSRKNMTLDALKQQLEEVGELQVVAKVTPLLKTYDTSCEKVRNRRNKWIAHFDLQTMLASKVTPLEGPSRAEIETALKALREVMNCVELHYTNSQTAYEHFMMTHDGEALLFMLMRGIRYKELVDEGVVDFDDIRKRFPGGD
jgi:hypothetical protein